mmetsp:Transcript_24229/g.49031  ORF Transcript_24229/g.49031 Transcript_24229/m.49031 type:complete len:288 (-) Transcript_24229:1476-2339(-)
MSTGTYLLLPLRKERNGCALLKKENSTSLLALCAAPNRTSCSSSAPGWYTAGLLPPARSLDALSSCLYVFKSSSSWLASLLTCSSRCRSNSALRRRTRISRSSSAPYGSILGGSSLYFFLPPSSPSSSSSSDSSSSTSPSMWAPCALGGSMSVMYSQYSIIPSRLWSASSKKSTTSSAVSSGTWSHRSAPYSSEGASREFVSASKATNASHGDRPLSLTACRTKAACARCFSAIHSSLMLNTIASGVSCHLRSMRRRAAMVVRKKSSRSCGYASWRERTRRVSVGLR